MSEQEFNPETVLRQEPIDKRQCQVCGKDVWGADFCSPECEEKFESESGW